MGFRRDPKRPFESTFPKRWLTRSMPVQRIENRPGVCPCGRSPDSESLVHKSYRCQEQPNSLVERKSVGCRHACIQVVTYGWRPLQGFCPSKIYAPKIVRQRQIITVSWSYASARMFDLVYTILSQERGQKRRKRARSQRRVFEYGRLNTSFLVFPLRPETS